MNTAGNQLRVFSLGLSQAPTGIRGLDEINHGDSPVGGLRSFAAARER
jgi:hypothetical protein